LSAFTITMNRIDTLHFQFAGLCFYHPNAALSI
jgi:hypothetical protein